MPAAPHVLVKPWERMTSQQGSVDALRGTRWRQGGAIKPTSVTLWPGRTGSDSFGVENRADGSQDILLGKPVIRISHEDIFDEARSEKIAELVGDWVAIDRFNIVNRHAGLTWVLGPVTYETGKRPGPERSVSLYWHPQNLETCRRNLGLSGTQLWRVLRHSQIGVKTDVTKPPWPAGREALREMLIWCVEVYPELGAFLYDLDAP